MKKKYSLIALCVLSIVNVAVATVNVGIVHGKYSWNSYTPASQWDQAIKKSLEWKISAKADITKPDQVIKLLDTSNILLFVNGHDREKISFTKKQSAKLRSWVANGGMLIVCGVSNSKINEWFGKTFPELSVRYSTCKKWLEGKISQKIQQVHKFPDGLWYNAFQISKSAQRPFAWGNYPAIAAKNNKMKVGVVSRDNKAKLLYCSYKKGLIVVSNLFYGSGFDEYLLENLWLMRPSVSVDKYVSKLDPRETVSQRLANLPQNIESQSRKLSIDKTGLLISDGQRFFPNGMYCVKNAESVDVVRKYGFNYVHDYHSKADNGAIKMNSDTSWALAAMISQLLERRKSSSIILNEIMEEPSCQKLDLFWVKKRNAIFKKLLPNTPTAMLMCNPTMFGIYGDIADVIILDPYPIVKPDSDLLMMKSYIAASKYFYPHKPVWICLQTHFFKEGDKFRNIEPSPVQIRAMMYFALVCDAKGLIWFALDDDGTKSINFLRNKDGSFNEPKWSTVTRLSHEFNSIYPWLVSGNYSKACLVKPNKSKVTARLWKYKGKDLLIVVNPLSKPQRASVMVEACKGAKWKAVFEKEPQESRDSSVTLNLAPYEVYVLVREPNIGEGKSK